MQEYRKVEPVSFVFVGLTYAGDNSAWSPRDITYYRQLVRLHLGDKWLGDCWVAEPQERGVIHYHMIIAISGKFGRIPKPDASGMWSHGSSRVKRCWSVGYLVKYVGKAEAYVGIPAGAHIYGASFAVRVREVVKKTWVWERVPRWLREALVWDENFNGAKRVPVKYLNSWWVDGKPYRSPYVWVGSLGELPAKQVSIWDDMANEIERAWSYVRSFLGEVNYGAGVA